MNIEDIRIFIEINRCRGISAAARALFLSQSTVSRRLLMLEKELNVKLFIRGKGYETLTATQAGERFLLLSEQIIAFIEEANSLQESGQMRHLSVAAPDSLASYFFRDFFYQFADNEPNWDMEIAIHDSVTIYEMVGNRMVDIGLTNGEAPHPELVSAVIFQEDFVVMRRGGEREQRKELISPPELDSKHEIFQIFSAEFNRWHNSWWKPGLAKLRVNMAHFTAGFLRDKEDWAILPESVARALLPADGYLQRLTEEPPKRRCFLVTHKKLRFDRVSAIHEFSQKLQEYLRVQGFPCE